MTAKNPAGAWAVLSTFNPGLAAERAVTSVVNQVEGVIVVDDGTGPAADEVLNRLAATGALVYRHHENRGIAAALNTAMRLARERGAESVITLDQDSVVPSGFVQALHAAKDAAIADGVRVGAVVPEYFAAVRQARGPIGSYGLASNVIQSGMLLPLPVVSAVGELRTDLFIDLVDTELELRLRREGYTVLAAPGLRLGHALGRQYRRELFGREVQMAGIPPQVTLSTPFRYFYRLRNRIIVNREYLRVAPKQIMRDTALELVHFVNALWLARPRRALWSVYKAAVSAAVHGQMGKMPTSLQATAASVVWNAPVLETEPE